MKHKAEQYDLVQGIGKITIVFDNKQPLPYYSITIHNADAKIEYFGAKALELGTEFFKDEEKLKHKPVTIEEAIAAAETATDGKIHDSTRKEENKLARYYVAWYCVRYIKATATRAGKLIRRDHATVLHGLKAVEKDDRYKTQFEIDTFANFKKQIKLYV